MPVSVLKGRAGRSAGWLGAALVVVAAFEGLRTEAYRDVVGVPTICYGETQGVRMGDTATTAECQTMLAERVAEFDAGLTRCLPALPTLPDRTRAALASWAYNVGLGNACKSTLVRRANAGDLAGACNELPRWNRAGGKVVRGLTRRRAEERAMCLAGLDDPHP